MIADYDRFMVLIELPAFSKFAVSHGPYGIEDSIGGTKPIHIIYAYTYYYYGCLVYPTHCIRPLRKHDVHYVQTYTLME